MSKFSMIHTEIAEVLQKDTWQQMLKNRITTVVPEEMPKLQMLTTDGWTEDRQTTCQVHLTFRLMSLG